MVGTRHALIAALVLSAASLAAAQAPLPAVVAAPAPTVAPVASVVPLANFAQPPFISQPQLSPDGTTIAGIVSSGGKQLVMMRGVFGSESPALIGLAEASHAYAISWVNNDNLLIHLSQLLPVETDRWTVSRLVGVSRKTHKITKILWNSAGQSAANVVWQAHDGSPEVLIAAQNSIYLGEEFWPAVWRVNVENGKAKSALKGRANVMNWYADGAGQLRAGVSYEDTSRKFNLLYRPTGSGMFKIIESANARRRESLTEPFLFLPGTSHALAIHDNDAGFSAIYEIDLPTQSDVRTVFTAPAGSEVSRVRLSSDGTVMLAADFTGTTAGTTWFDPALAKLQADLDKTLPTQTVRIVSMSADQSRLLVVVDRADTPGSLFFLDTAEGTMHRIAWFNEKLGSKPLSPVKMVRYKARDGLEIEAVLTLPRGRDPHNLPVILLPHGGPWAYDTPDYDYWAQFMASRGYAVIQPNFRGSTGYGSEFTRKGEGQLGLAMQDDITDALAWAVKAGIADPARACIVGASYGGYAAMWGIAKDPGLYRCAIAIAGVSNLRSAQNDFNDSLMSGKYRDDWKRMTPDFAAVSPVKAIAQIKAPLLLIHGRKDITVDFKQSQDMFNRMREAGKVVELVPLDQGDHYFGSQADRTVLLTAIERWLLKYNPPNPAAAKP